MILLNQDINWEAMNVSDFNNEKYKFKYGDAYGIGYYRKPFSRSRKNSDKDDCWTAWIRILKDVSKGQASICEEWKEFYCFKDWYKKHDYYIEGDRIFLTTKVFSNDFYYSPETCVFASRRITQFIMPDIYGEPVYDEDGIEMPLGIVFRKENIKWKGHYVANYTDLVTESKGTKVFKNKEEAVKFLQKTKNEGAKMLAEQYKPYITEKLYRYLKYEYEWKPIYRSDYIDKTE